MLRSIKKLGHRGDTIVEVMVVLAVLGLAIGIAYETASRSLLDTSQAEENAQATNYAQSEVEDLRYLAPSSVSVSTANGFNSPTNIFEPTGAYCIKDATLPSPIITTTAGCTFGNVPYQVLIYNCDYYIGASTACSGTVNNSDSFVVQAVWPDISGQGSDSATLIYRVHAP